MPSREMLRHNYESETAIFGGMVLKKIPQKPEIGTKRQRNKVMQLLNALSGTITEGLHGTRKKMKPGTERLRNMAMRLPSINSVCTIVMPMRL